MAAGRGIACSRNGDTGIPSFSGTDAGKPGTPALSAVNRSMLHAIEHYVHSPYVRYAFVGGEFVVFDATDGPCSGGVYTVLTAACEVYSPSDNLGYTTAPSREGCRGTPPPWLHNE